jgi:hypothetical protein
VVMLAGSVRCSGVEEFHSGSCVYEVGIVDVFEQDHFSLRDL